MSKAKRIKNVDDVMARKNRRHGLLPMRKSLDAINKPEKDLKIIHFAGTNGKGSTVNYLKDILMVNGYKVATFTSPHLISHFDRIRINDIWISEEDFNNYLREYEDIILDNDLGMFEIDLLIALAYFKEKDVDYVLLETGLGGRLDNTNVIDNTYLEVITSIGKDHIDVLGERIEQIAFEKAGIIKKSTTCIINAKIKKEAKKIIQYKALKEGANLIQNKYRKTGRYTFIFDNYEYEVSGASYQKSNAALALNIASILQIDIKNNKVKEAIKNSLWKGRFEQIKDKPLIVIDGAHNIEGIKALIEASEDLKKPIKTIFASLKDKKGNEMVDLLKGISEEVIITEFANPRIRHIEEYDVDTKKIKDYKEAINETIKTVKDGSILIAGSLYFISLVRDYLVDKNV